MLVCDGWLLLLGFQPFIAQGASLEFAINTKSSSTMTSFFTATAVSFSALCLLSRSMQLKQHVLREHPHPKIMAPTSNLLQSGQMNSLGSAVSIFPSVSSSKGKNGLQTEFISAGGGDGGEMTSERFGSLLHCPSTSIESRTDCAAAVMPSQSFSDNVVHQDPEEFS